MLLPCEPHFEDEPRHDLAHYDAQIEASELALQGDGTNTLPMWTENEHEHSRDVEQPLVLSEYEIVCHIRKLEQGTEVVYYLSVSMLNVLTCLCAGGYSSGTHYMKEEFYTSSIMATAGLSIYILGFAFGPIFLAPLSEHWGRNPIYIWSWLLLVVLQTPAALAPNISALVGIRFLQGFVGSAPLTNTGGTIADLWERDYSGAPMAIYGLSSTLGPPIALPLTGYFAQDQGWRMLFWFFMAVLGFAWILLALTLSETRHPVILKQKMRRLRDQLTALGYPAAKYIQSPPDRGLGHLFKVTLTRPIRFLFTEPITFCAALYNGLIYGLVFLFNESFPMVFGRLHHFTPAQTSLTFLGLCVGSLLASLAHPIQERHYLQVRTPEARVWLSLPACFLLPISLFWFGATSSAQIHWIVPIIASTLFGAGIFVVVLGVLNFVLDSYGPYTASSLAGVILVRNVVGAGFPLFAESMYEGMGYKWASILLGFLALLFCAVPFLFYYWGAEIRKWSKWASRNQNMRSHEFGE